MITPIKATDIKIDSAPKTILLYGAPKCGKTLFGSFYPKGLALIDFEHGAATLRGLENIDVYELYKTPINMQINEFNTIIKHLAADSLIKTIMIDNLYYLSRAWMFKIHGSSTSPPQQKDWFIYNQEMQKMIISLRDDYNKNIIINAHIKYDEKFGKGFPLVDGTNIRCQVGGMFDEFYLLKTSYSLDKIKYEVCIRGDNICNAGTRYAKTGITSVDWTNKNPFTLLQSLTTQKGGFNS